MRKRNTKEILELSSLQVRSFSENIDPELNKQQEVVNKERKKREDAKAKAGYTEVRRRQIIRQGASDALDAKQKRKERIEKAERQKKKEELFLLLIWNQILFYFSFLLICRIEKQSV